MKRVMFFLIILPFAISLTSCEKLLEVERPINKQVSEYVFSNNETAKAAGLGMYASIQKYAQASFSGSFTIFLGFASDELSPVSTSDGNWQYRENRLLPNNSVLTNDWSTCYAAIYHINLFLDKIAKSDKVDVNLKKRLTAEGKFLRALVYFYLVNIYENIPLIKAPDYHKNGTLAKSTPEEVYPFIVKDLEEAYQELTSDYLSPEPIRANKWAAAALLARVHLYRENWKEAEKYASEVIGSKQYALVKVDEIGLNSNIEAIFQMVSSLGSISNNYDASRLLEISLSTLKPYNAVVDPLLLSAFTVDDKRGKSWILEHKDLSNTTYQLAYKYKIGSSADNRNKPRIEHLTVLRLGEQHLILAEALAQQEKYDEAIIHIDSIRARAGVTLLKNMTVTKTKEAFVDLILEERQKELCFELGHRWFDLNRTGRADAYFSSLSYKDWQPTDRYFPIPESEILLNPFLKQNDGYEQ